MTRQPAWTDPHGLTHFRDAYGQVGHHKPGATCDCGPTVEERTPDEWIAHTGIRILDPDGWDRANFAEDWAKPLTWAEFEHKAAMSTSDLASRMAVDDRLEGTGVAVSAAHGSGGGQGGSSGSDAAQGDLAATYHALSEAYREMTRQRDEAVKALQRERARVGRAEALANEWERSPGYVVSRAGVLSPAPVQAPMIADLRAALADRPTDD